MNIKNLIKLLVCLAVVFAIVFISKKYNINLETIKDFVQSNQSYIQQNLFYSAAIFFFVYLGMVALSIPGAVLLTLLAGALFGNVYGLILVSFASSVGASLVFIFTRFLFSNFVEKKFPNVFKKINAGVKKEGAMFLFVARLLPIFPFFVINAVFGLTKLPLKTFYWVSQLGMLPGTFIYVNAGKQLSTLESLSGILSPNILISFIALAIFPFIAKFIINFVKKGLIFRKYKKPAKFDANLIVIGAGSAGLITTYIAAVLKAKVILIEKAKMGGDCLNYGCVPSKSLISAAKAAKVQKDAAKFGITYDSPKIDGKKVFEHIHKSIATIAPNDSRERYESLGVKTVAGDAKIISPWEVEIKDENQQKYILSAAKLVVATGANPSIPKIDGLDKVDYLTSDSIWSLTDLPKSLAVVGGGVIGIELSQAFARLGVKVTLIDAQESPMIREGEEVSELVSKSLIADGMEIFSASMMTSVTQDEEGVKHLSIKDKNDKTINLKADEILVAVGRTPTTKGFGLEDLGLLNERGELEVNEYLQTSMPNIYAAGDIIGPYRFTHMAGHHAWYVAVNALFGFLKKFKVSYKVVPYVVFCDPEIGRVGLNKAQAEAQGLEFDLVRYNFSHSDRAITEGKTEGFIEIITPKGKDKILGATIVGPSAGELLHEIVLAMTNNLGLNKILSTIHAYPSYSDAVKLSAGVWKNMNAPKKLLNFLEKIHSKFL